jgi:Bacterial antitoxin of type II TA system, VapB
MDKTIEIDDALVEAAQDLTGETDERAAVKKVLRDAANQMRSRSVPWLSSFAGRFDFADGYDVLKERGTRGREMDRSCAAHF